MTLETPSEAPNGPVEREPFPPFTKAFQENKEQILFEWEVSTAYDQAPEKKREIKSYLASRDKWIDTITGLPFSDMDAMDVHHIDEIRRNWHRSNLCLITHGGHARLNAQKFNERRKRALQELGPTSSQLYKERENERRPKENDPFSNRKSFEAAPHFRKVVFMRMYVNLKTGESSTRAELLLEACIKSGLLNEAGERHMQLLCDSKFSPLEEDREKGRVYFREPEYKFLTSDEMLQLFPLSGTRIVDEIWRERTLDRARDEMRMLDEKQAKEEIAKKL